MEPEVDPRFDDDRITAVGMLIEANAAVEAATSGTLERAGLAGPWFEVLLRLGRTPEHRLRMSDLARAMSSITPSGLTRLIDRMSDAGLVERVQCEEDRRGAFAVLTPAGEERLASVLPAHLEDLERVYTSVLSCAELTAVTDALRKVRDAASDSSSPLGP